MEEITEAVVFEKYPAYKDSGVEWLGEVPEHWEVMRIRTIAEIVNGATPASGVEAYWDGDILWVTPAEINNIVYLNDSIRKITYKGYKNCGTSLVPKGSIILTTRAPIGKLAIANKTLCTNQGCKSIKLKDHNSEYLYFQLLIRTGEINALGTGTTFMELGNIELKNLQVICPPINEQKAIACFLESKTEMINQAIVQKERQIELLKERRKVLIHRAVTRGLNLNVQFKDSGVEWIGEIPYNWEVKRLKTILQPGRDGIRIGPFGSSIKSEILKPKGFKIYGQEHVIGSDFNIGQKYIDENDFKRLSNYELFAGDIVITMMGTAGKCKVVPDFIEKGIMDSHLIRVRTNFSVANPEYVAFLINDSQYIFDQIKINNKGSIMEGLNSSIVKSLLLLLPPIEEQKEILINIDVFNQKIATAIFCKEKEIEKLKEYKATLINSAVTGKIKVA